MSYILDALKKLEEKQEREEPARTAPFFRKVGPGRPKRSPWPYALACALLLNALVLIFWMQPSRHEQRETRAGQAPPEVSRPAAAPPASAAHAPLAPRQEAAAPHGGAPSAVPEGPVPAGGPAAQARQAATPVKTPESLQAGIPAEAARPLPAPEAGKEKTRRAAGRVLPMNELPATVKAGLPRFTITGHAYSPDPQTRVVRINEKILQEGQELVPGLRLEEIVPDGVIFGSQGYHFFVGINGRQ